MRIGIFSDVHANLEALLAVINGYKREEIDMFLYLGDIVGYGAEPESCCKIVKEMVEKAVLGNHDAAVIGKMDYSFYYDSARYVIELHRDMLSKENLEWLSSLNYMEVIEVDGLKLQLTHGSPLKPEEFEYIFTIEQARQLLYGYESLPKISLIGHSHLYRVYALSPGEVVEVNATKFGLRKDCKYIISVGSVGQPRDYDNRAGYCILDTKDMEFEIKRIPYDIETAAEKIKKAGIDLAFATRLFIGI